MQSLMDRNVLDDLKQRLDELVTTLEEATREVSVLLQQGNGARGMNGLREVLEALQFFHEGLDVLTLADSATYNGLADLKDKLEQVYPSIYNALEADDTVTLADVLEYELAATFANYNTTKAD
ncbi:MAG: hypothetical protein AB1374_06685 [Bacillota bacterium]